MLDEELQKKIETRIDKLSTVLSGFSPIEGKRKLAEMEAEIAAAELAVAKAELKLKRARLEAERVAQTEAAPKKKPPQKKPPVKKPPARTTPPNVNSYVGIPRKNKRPLVGIVLKVTATQAYVGVIEDKIVKRVFWRNLDILEDISFFDFDDDALHKGGVYSMFYTGRYLDKDGQRKNGPAVVTATYIGNTEDTPKGMYRMRLIVRNHAAGGIISRGGVVNTPKKWVLSVEVV